MGFSLVDGEQREAAYLSLAGDSSEFYAWNAGLLSYGQTTLRCAATSSGQG